MDECKEWLKECLLVFPKIKKKKINIAYKDISSRKLGYVKARIERKINFDPEALMLGQEANIKEEKCKPKEFNIFINKKITKIDNIALRKEVAQNIIIHELLHIENEDLFTLSKTYKKRKKKKIHINDFEEDIFKRYNKLREIKGIMQIQKREHLEIAIQKILQKVRWFEE